MKTKFIERSEVHMWDNDLCRWIVAQNDQSKQNDQGIVYDIALYGGLSPTGIFSIGVEVLLSKEEQELGKLILERVCTNIDMSKQEEWELFLPMIKLYFESLRY